jgi:hypothetical protein
MVSHTYIFASIFIVSALCLFVSLYTMRHMQRLQESFIGRKKVTKQTAITTPQTKGRDIMSDKYAKRVDITRCEGDKNGQNKPVGCECKSREQCEAGGECVTQKTDKMPTPGSVRTGLISMDVSARCAVCQEENKNDYCPCKENNDCKSKKCMTADGETFVCVPSCQAGTQTDTEDCGGVCSDTSCASGYYCDSKQCKICSTASPFNVGCYGCKTNNDCQTGFCETNSGQCQRRCTQNSQCEKGQKCNIRGVCQKCSDIERRRGQCSK